MSIQTAKFILGMELMSGKKRMFYGPIFFLTYIFGIIIFPGVVALLMNSFKVQYHQTMVTRLTVN